MKYLLILSLIALSGCAAQARGVGIFKGCGIWVGGAGIEATKEAIQDWDTDASTCRVFIGTVDEEDKLTELELPEVFDDYQ
jgi:hypothetical protein